MSKSLLWRPVDIVVLSFDWFDFQYIWLINYNVEPFLVIIGFLNSFDC